jgi:hypothetical protein
VDPSDVKAEEIYPSKIYLYIDEDKLDEERKSVADVIVGLMSRIKSAGVGLKIFYQTYSGGISNLYLAAMTFEHVRLRIGPEPTDNRIAAVAPLKAAVTTFEIVQVKYKATENMT